MVSRWRWLYSEVGSIGPFSYNFLTEHEACIPPVIKYETAVEGLVGRCNFIRVEVVRGLEGKGAQEQGHHGLVWQIELMQREEIDQHERFED